MTNELFNSLSDNQIEEALAQYKGVPSIVTLLNGIKEVREANRKQAQEALETQAQVEQVKVEFANKAAKLAKLPTPPEGIYNVYLVYGDIDDLTKPEEVEITKPNGDKVVETRYPKIKGWKVETNKGFLVSKSSMTKPEATTKRAISVSKRSPTNPNQLELVGHFKSASQACQHLKLIIGMDSANRVLQREGYFTEPYTGTNFTTTD